MEAREQDLFADFDSRAEENSPAVDAVDSVEPSETPEAMADEPEPDYVVYEAEPIGDGVGPVEYVDEVVVYDAMPVEDVDDSGAYEPEPMQTATTEPVATSEPDMKGSVGLLFRTFFKIGIVTFGGGYAMIPMIESEVVNKRQWVEKAQFLDLIAIAQTCPGVFAINISTFIGYKLRRTPGALLAALGAALPSFLIILAIAMVFRQFQDIPWVAACFKGIRPAVVALIAVPTFNLAKSAQINLSTIWIPIFGAFLICVFSVNPIFVILGAAFLGYLYGMFLNN